MLVFQMGVVIIHWLVVPYVVRQRCACKIINIPCRAQKIQRPSRQMPGILKSVARTPGTDSFINAPGNVWCRSDISTVWIWWMENTVVCGRPMTHITAPLKYEVDWPSASRVMERNTKIDRAPPLIHTITPLKYKIDWPSTSLVMERNIKSEMATRWPYWKSDRD
jgi:hypothetical protein